MLTIIIIILAVLVIARFKKKSIPIGNWSHLFSDMQQDPEAFYQMVEEILDEKQIPDLYITRRTFKQGNMLSHTRLYLEVYRGEFIIHICAAPWGKGFFFSTWSRKTDSSLLGLLSQIPIIGGLFAELDQYNTYYKLDTDTMFRTSVHQSVLEAIDMITESKGVRGLSELERTNFNTQSTE